MMMDDSSARQMQGIACLPSPDCNPFPPVLQCSAVQTDRQSYVDLRTSDIQSAIAPPGTRTSLLNLRNPITLSLSRCEPDPPSSASIHVLRAPTTLCRLPGGLAVTVRPSLTHAAVHGTVSTVSTWTCSCCTKKGIGVRLGEGRVYGGRGGGGVRKPDIRNLFPVSSSRDSTSVGVHLRLGNLRTTTVLKKGRASPT